MYDGRASVLEAARAMNSVRLPGPTPTKQQDELSAHIEVLRSYWSRCLNKSEKSMLRPVHIKH